VGRLLRAVTGCAAILVGGCSTVLGIDDLVADRQGGSTSGAGGCASTCGTPGCGACPAPPQVEVSSTNGTYRIDAYEVTNAEYDAWLASNPATVGQRFDCEWNDTYRPGVYSQALIDATPGGVAALAGDCLNAAWLETQLEAGNNDEPVTCVDWCDAVAYCEWAGKHLCGRIGGGSFEITHSAGGVYATANESAWYHACSDGGTRAFPYGAEYDPTRCNDDENLPKDVGSEEQCEGGLPGIFDMSGNVGEWEDACTEFDPPVAQNCLVRGGTWYNTAEGDLACDAFRALIRGGNGNGIGFRCCG
jgi:formylglycine-generating enzyme required for sulfatase activity